MALSQKSPAIVMLTQIIENKQIKATKYWPECKINTWRDCDKSCELNCCAECQAYVLAEGEEDESCSRIWLCGVICITAIGARILENGIIERRFSIAEYKRGCDTPINSHKISHFHFTGWEDGKSPNINTFMKLIDTVNSCCPPIKFSKDSIISSPPIIVHCSAGVGRTGTYIVADLIRQDLQDGRPLRTINLYDYVRKVREQRMRLVHNDEQFAFLRSVLNIYEQQRMNFKIKALL